MSDNPTFAEFVRGVGKMLAMQVLSQTSAEGILSGDALGYLREPEPEPYPSVPVNRYTWPYKYRNNREEGWLWLSVTRHPTRSLLILRQGACILGQFYEITSSVDEAALDGGLMDPDEMLWLIAEQDRMRWEAQFLERLRDWIDARESWKLGA